MNDPSPLLDRSAIEHAFRLLGERLARRGIVADLYVFGGAAMAPPSADEGGQEVG